MPIFDNPVIEKLGTNKCCTEKNGIKTVSSTFHKSLPRNGKYVELHDILKCEIVFSFKTYSTQVK